MKLTPQSLAKQFCSGIYVNSVDAVLWQETFAYLAERADAQAFHPTHMTALWVRYGSNLRALIKNDALILSVLKRSLPDYTGDGCMLFRGESWFLFDQQQIGFSWTPSEERATAYAKGLNAVESGGVLLKCYAPAAAILAVHQTPRDTVFICDPTQLLQMTSLALFPKP